MNFNLNDLVDTSPFVYILILAALLISVLLPALPSFVAHKFVHLLVMVLGSVFASVAPIKGDQEVVKKIYGSTAIGAIIGGVVSFNSASFLNTSDQSLLLITVIGALVVAGATGGAASSRYCTHCPASHPDKTNTLCYKGACSKEFGPDWAQETQGVCIKGSGLFAPRKFRSVRAVKCRMD